MISDGMRRRSPSASRPNPDASGEPSPGLRPAGRCPGTSFPPPAPRPERALQTSIPHLSFVVRDFITTQKRPEFVLVRNLPMLLTLIPNVPARAPRQALAPPGRAGNAAHPITRTVHRLFPQSSASKPKACATGRGQREDTPERLRCGGGGGWGDRVVRLGSSRGIGVVGRQGTGQDLSFKPGHAAAQP